MTTLAKLYSLAARGTLTFQPDDPQRPHGTYVLQRVRAGLGNIAADPTRTTQLRRWVKPADPSTPRQLAVRARFNAAVITWHALPQTDRDYWRDRGADIGLPAINAFVSYYCRTHPLEHYAPLHVTSLPGARYATPGAILPGSPNRTI